MADIRINALATTAASTASDDFIAVDGSANGTRKLNAYSPTFGGNLTVGGTITLPSNNWISSGTNLIRDSYFGYSTSYRLIQVGTTGGISLGADLTGNAAGSFNGAEIVIPNNRAVIAPNAANNSYVGVLKVGSDNKVYLGGNDYQTLGAVVLNGTSAEVVGNLTVSGTGTSSFGGEPSTGLATYTGNLRIQSSGNGPAAVNGIELQNSQSGSGYGYKIYTNNSNDYIGIAGRFGSATWTEFVAIKQNTGNLLIGTTTDSSNGKLQLATHTTSAGGIGFGTDTSLYRSAAYTLKLDGGNNVTSFRVLGSGSCEALMAVASASSVLFGSTTAGASTVLCSGNGTTALTLDSSQNATFAGTATVNGGVVKLSTTVLPNLQFYASSDSTDQKYWDIQTGQGGPGDGTFRLRAINDARTSGINAIVVKRSGVSSVTINFPNLPTSSSGLSAGDIWNDSGTLKIVQP